MRATAASGDDAAAAEKHDAREREIAGRRKVATYEAARRALRDGEYRVFDSTDEQRGQASRSVPSGWEKVTLFTHRDDGAPVAVVFPLDPEQHTGIRDANREFARLERCRRADEIDARIDRVSYTLHLRR